MTTRTNYLVHARVITAAWYLCNVETGLDLEVLAGEIANALESAHQDGYQAAMIEQDRQPEPFNAVTQ